MGDVVQMGEATLPPDFESQQAAWSDYAEQRAIAAKKQFDAVVPQEATAVRLAASVLVRWSVDAALAKGAK